MGFNCGIVGLPNVGKSTIFNALTQTQAAQAANYPFCTIEPNTGMVTVPDPRMWVLQGIAKTDKVIPTQIELVDIAGLVKGASKGEGMAMNFFRRSKTSTRFCTSFAASMNPTSFMSTAALIQCATLKSLIWN